MRRIPVIGYAQAGARGYFDDAGYPTGNGWDELLFPEINDTHAYALEISGDSMAPVYRDGDRIVVSPSASPRRGDRVVVKTTKGEVMVKELKRRTAELEDMKALVYYDVRTAFLDVEAQLLAVGARGVLARTVAVFGENEDVRGGVVVGNKELFPGMGPRPGQRLRAVTLELGGREAFEVVEQHVVGVVLLLGGAGVDEAARAEAGAGVVGLAVAPVQQSAVIVGHDALVGLADEGLGTLRGEQTAGPGGVGVVGDDPTDPRDGVVERDLGLGGRDVELRLRGGGAGQELADAADVVLGADLGRLVAGQSRLVAGELGPDLAVVEAVEHVAHFPQHPRVDPAVDLLDTQQPRRPWIERQRHDWPFGDRVTLLHAAGKPREKFGVADPALRGVDARGPLEELLA